MGSDEGRGQRGSVTKRARGPREAAGSGRGHVPEANSGELRERRLKMTFIRQMTMSYFMGPARYMFLFQDPFLFPFLVRDMLADFWHG